MKKFLCVLFCVFAGVFAVFAEDQAVAVSPAAGTTAFNFNLVTDSPIPLIIDGARINIIYGRAQEVKGLSLGLVNVTDGILKGAESGFVNYAGGIEGCQAGFVNTAGSLTGAMTGFVNVVSGGTTGVLSGFVNAAKGVTGVASGFVNVIDGDLNGCAAGFVNTTKNINGVAAGFVNLAGEVNGGQAGFVNAAKSVKGVQAGFVNIAEKNEGVMSGFVNISDELDGVALGMVNVIKGGFGKISAYSSVETLYNVAFKSGKTVYGIVGAGYDHRDIKYSDKYVSTAGLGIHADLKPLFIELEALANVITDCGKIGHSFDWKTDITANSELRLLPGVKVMDLFEIYAGPSVKYYYNYDDIKSRHFSWDNFKISAVAGISINVF